MKITEKRAHARNFGGVRTGTIEYIVIHYTANLGDTAANNAAYFAREVVGASAHYFVDEHAVWRSVPDDAVAWHCGGGLQGAGGHAFFGRCANDNSLGVELCLLDSAGQVRQDTVIQAAALVRTLMRQYAVEAARVIRHYDVTGKNCPAPMVAAPALWQAFRELLQEEEMKTYRYYEDMPVWAQPTISKLVRKGLLKGDGDGALDLGEDALKVLVVNDRAGLYGADKAG